jgi:hypothetical protein
MAYLQAAKGAALFPALTQHMLDAYTMWPETTLDPARSPLSLPESGTLDAHLRALWYTSPHISHAIFLRDLRGGPVDTDGVANATRAPDSVAERQSEEHVSTAGRSLGQRKLRGMADGVITGASGMAAGAEHGSGLLRAAVPNSSHAVATRAGRAWAERPPVGAHDSNQVGLPSTAQGETLVGSRAVELDGGPRIEYTIMINETAKHIVPVAVNSMSNAILATLSSVTKHPTGGRATANDIRTFVTPFPIFGKEHEVRMFEYNGASNAEKRCL